MSSNPTNTAPVKRACDSCHRRKVKCIGEGTAPCKNCVSAGLVCTYNAIPQKKGPKGSRAKVLSELRESQRNVQLTASFPSELGIDGRISPFAYARTQGLLPAGLVESCIEIFYINAYPFEPVLHRHKIQEAALNMERSTEAYCLVVALCAFVMLQANMELSSSVVLPPEIAQMSNSSIGHILLEESVRVRTAHNYREIPTHLTVLTSWFYYKSYFGLAKENTAWAYLREATTQAQLLGMHDEEAYEHDPLDISRKRVLYWALFMAEREHALQNHRPISLYPTIHAPNLDEAPSERPIAVGLGIMTNMFQIIDDTYVNLWNRVHNHANPAWLTQLQTRISETVPVYLECTEAQAILIRITQQWLRMQVWQLCVCQGQVSSVSNDTSLTLTYPVEISRDLLTITHQFAPQAMELHGAGLIEKLFSITCCLIDVVACTSSSPEAFALGPRDYVSRLVTLISTLHGGQSRYLPPLFAKLSDVLPHFPLPQSLKFPETMSMSAIGIGATESGTDSSSIDDDQTVPTAVNLSTYPSTDLIRRLAAQTGTQLPFVLQQPMLSPPTAQVEDLSIYDSPHSTTHSSASGHRSNTATPASFESPLAPSGSQIMGHSSMQRPSSHAQHGHLQSHHVGINIDNYDPRLSGQGYSIDHDMTFK